jgi:hypothetical protein
LQPIFNPYREWLGWEQSRAPDYYELLAIDRHESDATRIALAAEQAIVKVRSFRPGQQAGAWSRLLDEIRAAKECLCNSTLRQEYDAALARSDVFPSAAGGLQASVTPAPLPSPDWAAGPSPTYDPQARAVRTPIGAIPGAATVAMSASPYSGATDELPMAIALHSSAPHKPSQQDEEPAGNVEALLPPGSDDELASTTGMPVEPAPHDTIRLSAAPTAASFSAARKQTSRSLFLLAVAACIALFAITAGLVATRRPSHNLQRQTTPPQDEGISSSTAENNPPEQHNRPQMTVAERGGATANIDQPPTPTLAASGAEKSSMPTTLAAPERSAPAPRATEPAMSEEERRSRAQSLVAALQTARSALGEQNFPIADEQIRRSESFADKPEHREATARLKEVAAYVKQFRAALSAAVQGLQAAETFKTSSGSDAAFVEATADTVVLHVSGTNRTYRLTDLPPALALALADRKLSARDPVSLVVKGAYLAVHPRADSQTREKAASLWQQAAAAGADVSHLTPFLSEGYAGFLTDIAP